MYILPFCTSCLLADAESIADMIELLESSAADLRELEAKGVTLAGFDDDGRAGLVTDDPAVAEQFGFEEAAEVDEEKDDDRQARGDDSARHVDLTTWGR